MEGVVFWSAAWERLLSDDQILFLSDSPNPFGRDAPPALLTGLVSQSDVNTDGRTDDAPFDHISTVVFGLENAPPVVAGAGGFDGLAFVTASEQSADGPPPSINYAAPFTMACRAKTSTAIVNNTAFGLGNGVVAQPLLFLKMTAGAGGNVQAFIRDDANRNTLVDAAPLDSADGAEHVLVFRSGGGLGGPGRLQLLIDGVLVDDQQGGYIGPTNINNQTWGALDIAGFAQWGTLDLYWTAIWDRLLSDTEVTALSATPNPFGRTP
jgi:hypothetical protein